MPAPVRALIERMTANDPDDRYHSMRDAGAAIAAIAPLFWLVACAVVLGRVSGLRTDALYLLGRSASPRSAPA